MIRAPFALVILACASLLLAACGSADVEKAEVERQVKDQFSKNDLAVASVDCPKDLPAEEGAEVNCDVVTKEDEEELGVDVTVTSVTGNDVKFNIEFDEATTDQLSDDIDAAMEDAVDELGAKQGPGDLEGSEEADAEPEGSENG